MKLVVNQPSAKASLTVPAAILTLIVLSVVPCAVSTLQVPADLLTFMLYSACAFVKAALTVPAEASMEV